MRYKEEAHARMIAAAGRGFRRRGFGGIGVDGLAKEAEVTSGGVTAEQVFLAPQGSTLTLTVGGSGQTVTISNYQAGRVTFSFARGDNSGGVASSGQPPGLAQDGMASA